VEYPWEQPLLLQFHGQNGIRFFGLFCTVSLGGFMSYTTQSSIIERENLMIEKKNPLENITVDGMTAEAYIHKEEEAEKKKEIQRVQREDGKVYLRKRPIGKVTASRSKERNGQVKQYSKDEIRRLKGIMNAPYSTSAENVLWVIREKGPVSLKDIAKELHTNKMNSISANLSTIWMTLGADQEINPQRVERTHDGKRYLYSPIGKDSFDVTEQYSKMKKANALIVKSRKSGKSPKTEPEEKSVVERHGLQTTDMQVDEIKKQLPGLDGAIQEALKDAVEKVLGVNVTVSGKIEFVFKLG